MVDDPFTTMDSDLEFEVMVPLMEDRVAYPICERQEAHFFFMTLGNLDKHLEVHHVQTPIQWECFQCGRSFPKLHGSRCHVTKCSSRLDLPTNNSGLVMNDSKTDVLSFNLLGNIM
jgi:hypothetical protein